MSNVFMVDVKSDPSVGCLATDFIKLLNIPELKKLLTNNRSIAIKVHIGEEGNYKYLSPSFISLMVDELADGKRALYVVDTSSITSGSRLFGDSWHALAAKHGFTYQSIGIDVVLADGYYGTDGDLVFIDKSEELAGVEIADAILKSDALIVITHVTADPLTGLWGALAHLGLGCLTKKGKRRVHKALELKFNPDKCNGCGICQEICVWNAIKVLPDKKVVIDKNKCISCGDCVIYCTNKALYFDNKGLMRYRKRIVESAKAVMEALSNNVFFINFLLDITPFSDNYPEPGSPIVPDIGILASKDPVAIDKASLDLINNAPGIPTSIANKFNALTPGIDKIKAIYGIDVNFMIEYAVKQGLGSNKYKLIKI